MNGKTNLAPLWRCPRCERLFANVNQSHACGRHELEPLFRGTTPDVRLTFDRVRAVAERLGPLEVLPEKTRIAFQVRMSFAAFMPRKRWLDGHVVLARTLDSPRFRRIEVYSPRNVLHGFRLHRPDEVDAEFEGWLAEAYEVGEQKHLGRDADIRPGDYEAAD